MKKKTLRKKPNEIELKRRAKDSLHRKLSYLIQQKDTIEFIAPEEHHWHRALANHQPLEKVDENGKYSHSGTLGQVKYFYIPETEMTRLDILFREFNIPEQLHKNIIWCYLNMVFAPGEALASDKIYSNINKSTDELVRLFEMLDRFQQEKFRLKAIDIWLENSDSADKHRKNILPN